jgi:hypothetical protein
MKKFILPLFILLYLQAEAQIIPITSVNNTVVGYMIKFKTFRALPGPAAATVDSL